LAPLIRAREISFPRIEHARHCTTHTCIIDPLMLKGMLQRIAANSSGSEREFLEDKKLRAHHYNNKRIIHARLLRSHRMFTQGKEHGRETMRIATMLYSPSAHNYLKGISSYSTDPRPAPCWAHLCECCKDGDRYRRRVAIRTRYHTRTITGTIRRNVPKRQLRPRRGRGRRMVLRLARAS